MEEHNNDLNDKMRNLFEYLLNAQIFIAFAYTATDKNKN